VNIEDVKELLKLVEDSESTDLEIEIRKFGGKSIRIRKGSGNNFQGFQIPAMQTPATPTEVPNNKQPQSENKSDNSDETDDYAGFVKITSPIVGTFYRAPSPDSEPYVEVGDNLAVGQVVCIVEAMKIMNEIKSEVSGTVERILVENAQPVEYGQVMFLIKPN